MKSKFWVIVRGFKVLLIWVDKAGNKKWKTLTGEWMLTEIELEGSKIFGFKAEDYTIPAGFVGTRVFQPHTSIDKIPEKVEIIDQVGSVYER